MRSLVCRWLDVRLSGSKVPTLVALVLGLLLMTVSGVARAATAYPCTEAGLDSALSAGGAATFNCAAVTTVTVGQTKTIAVNGTSIDGGGKLVISGGDSVLPIQVAAGVTATLSNVVIEHGKAASYGSNLAIAGTLSLVDSTVRSGTDGIGGAVWVQGGGTLTASGCAIVDNTTGAEGAVAVHGTATFVNTTVSGANFRGIIARFGGTVTVTYSTIVTTGGENLFAVGANDKITVGHSLLVAPNGTPSTAGSGSLVSLGYNILSKTGVAFTGDTTGNQLDVVPLLGPLADNGGPTMTRALLSCSPGINAGATSGGPAVDQRGQPRNQNGAIDVGAYESNLSTCLYVDDVTTTEGNAGTKALTFPVKLSGKSTLPISVDYAFADGTATVADGDYTAASGTLSFPAGTTSSSISAQIAGDVVNEPSETVLASLSSPTNAMIADASATGTITNDDAAPTLAIADLSLGEGTGGTTTADITVALNGATSQTVTVQYATANGTALAGADFTATSGTLTFAPGVLSKKISVEITPDAVFEGNETFGVSLSSPTNATIADGSGTVTIVDDEGNPGLSIGDVSISEGDMGTKVVNVVVTLSPASASSVTVDWSTVDGTATAADADYSSGSGTLTFAPGETSKSLDVNITGDLRDEPNESFVVHLANASGAQIADADGSVTITNDEAPVPDAGPDADADAPVLDAGPDAPVFDAGPSDGGSFDFGSDAGNFSFPVSSDEDCTCAFVGGQTPYEHLTVVGASVAVILTALRRRRRPPTE